MDKLRSLKSHFNVNVETSFRFNNINYSFNAYSFKTFFSIFISNIKAQQDT